MEVLNGIASLEEQVEVIGEQLTKSELKEPKKFKCSYCKFVHEVHVTFDSLKSNSDIGHRTENLLLTYKKYVQNTMQANKRLKNTHLLKKLLKNDVLYTSGFKINHQ